MLYHLNYYNIREKRKAQDTTIVKIMQNVNTLKQIAFPPSKLHCQRGVELSDVIRVASELANQGTEIVSIYLTKKKIHET